MATGIPDDLQQQLINDMLIESFEGLERFDREMLTLEKGAWNAETLNVIFRVIHTIKGTAGCIGLGKIESTAHVGESLLSLLRDGKLQPNSDLVSGLLALSDALRAIFQNIEQNGSEGSADYSELINRLQGLQGATATAAVIPSAPDTVPPTPEADEGFGFFRDAPDLVAKKPEPVSVPEGEPATVKASVSDSAIRVEVLQLDKLMNLVGELVLARNQIIQNVTQPDPAALLAASQRLNLITTELQGSVMKTRMQPIGNIWGKFPRIVRDVGRELGKPINLTMLGQETELDRTIIEAIKDPLTHIVRNAIDHGIEQPAARLALGKPAEGSLLLRAFHEGGQVNIEFSDDGGGINVARVKAKAIERGLLTADQAGRLSDREAFSLIFQPGFSTAEKVSNLSGRGVGMDVVRTNIEKIGGSVDVHSTEGKGTTLKIKIPLTLAIIPALIVTSGDERFAIPQVNLLELVRLEGEVIQQKIEKLYDTPVYRLRGQLLPLVDLNAHLRLESSAASDAVSIVVLQADGRQFGLIVDEINDAEEIVVKPLGKQLKSLSSFAGATIMGDGCVALIIDVLGVAQSSHVVTEVRDRSGPTGTDVRGTDDSLQTLLLFETGKGRPLAVPLSKVARLEELPPAQVEYSGHQRVVQYRGQIMPLIQLSQFIGDEAEPESENQDSLQVIVYSEGGRSVGLVVSRIKDIVHVSVAPQRSTAREGIVGSAVIQSRVTDLVDIEAIIRRAEPAFYQTQPDKAA